jgi:hypothetical protein
VALGVPEVEGAGGREERGDRGGERAKDRARKREEREEREGGGRRGRRGRRGRAEGEIEHPMTLTKPALDGRGGGGGDGGVCDGGGRHVEQKVRYDGGAIRGRDQGGRDKRER